MEEEYNKLNPTHRVSSETAVGIEYEENLVDSGQLIIDFYNNTFIPKYSHSQNPIIQGVTNSLEGSSILAKRHLENKNYFGLSVLFITRGSKSTDPNNLESLIQDLQNN